MIDRSRVTEKCVKRLTGDCALEFGKELDRFVFFARAIYGAAHSLGLNRMPIDMMSAKSEIG